MFTGILYTHIFYALGGSEMPNGQNLRPIAATHHRRSLSSYWSLARTAEAPLEHNFRYPRIRELMYMGGALALGAGPRTF